MTHHDEGKEIQIGKKQDAPGATEQTHSGPVFIPTVDIFETENDMHLSADMPGLIPEVIDRNKIDAHYNQGVLTLVMPKAEAAKPKKIEIRST